MKNKYTKYEKITQIGVNYFRLWTFQVAINFTRNQVIVERLESVGRSF